MTTKIKKLCRKTFYRSFLLQSCWNEERMQNLGFEWCLEPWLASIYPKGGTHLREAERRHLGFFNTQPYMAGIICGVTAHLEEAAAKDTARGARIVTLKNVLGATLAGIGDKFFWGTYRPFCAAAALTSGLGIYLLGAPGVVAAAGIAPVFLCLFNIPALWLRWQGVRFGYEQGEAVVEKMKQLSWQKQISRLRKSGRFLSVVLAVSALFLLMGNFPAPVFEKMPARAAVFIGCLGLKSLRMSVLRTYGIALGGSLVFALYWSWL